MYYVYVDKVQKRKYIQNLFVVKVSYIEESTAFRFDSFFFFFNTVFYYYLIINYEKNLYEKFYNGQIFHD